MINGGKAMREMARQDDHVNRPAGELRGREGQPAYCMKVPGDIAYI